MTIRNAIAILTGLAALGGGASAIADGAYVEVNGLRMYYESHGAGEPLVLLHGGLSTIDATFGEVLPALAKSRRVIAVEQQAHGHTGDIDRPLSYERMADDTDALLGQLGVAKADFFGWSDGANVAIEIAIRHPNRVGRLVLLGPHADDAKALGPEFVHWLETAKPEEFPPQARAAYTRASPDPEQWPVVFAKWRAMQLAFPGFADAALESITAPALVMSGDRGGDRPEHTVEIFRLLPNAQLAVLPNTGHFALAERPEWVLAAATAFLDGSGTPPSGTVVSRDGTTIAFDQTGSGPAVILIAGALSDRSGAARLASLLASHFTAISYDRRGRGESGDTKPYAVDREIEDIDALIDHAGGSAFLFGSSSGAALALEAAARLPQKVVKVVAFEPPFIVDDSRPPLPADYWQHVDELVSAGRRSEAVEYFMTVAVGVPAEYVAQMKNAPMWPGLERLAHTLSYDGRILGDRLSGKPLDPKHWASATMPVLVMDGGLSDEWLRHGARAAAEALPNAAQRTLEGQDHSATFSAPDVIASALIEYLEGTNR